MVEHWDAVFYSHWLWQVTCLQPRFLGMAVSPAVRIVCKLPCLIFWGQQSPRSNEDGKIKKQKVESSAPGPLGKGMVDLRGNPRHQSLGLPLESALCVPHMVIMGRLGWRRCVKCAPPRGPELRGCYYSRLLNALMSEGPQVSKLV